VANQAAFQSGWGLGGELLAHRRARKEALADEERQLRVSDLYGKGRELALNLSKLDDNDPLKAKGMDALTNIENSIREIYHPDNAPGALQRDWHWLSKLITGKRAKSAPQVMESTRGPGTSAATVTVPGSKVAFPSHPVTVNGKRINVPAPLLDTGPEAVTLSPSPAYQVVRPAPVPMTAQRRQQAVRMDEARARAEQDVMAAGFSPAQEAQQESAKARAYIEQSMKDFGEMNPQATPQEKADFRNDLIAKTYGFAQSKPVWKQYSAPDGSREWFDASRPDLIPPGWSASGADTSDTRARGDYTEYRKQHPDYGGSFEQWKTEQGQRGKLAVPTNRDDRFIQIEQKRSLGQPLSADDQAYSAAYDLYINKRVINPMLARAAAQGADRYVQVMDPSDPDRVTFMKAGDAARSKAGSPASISFQTDKAVTRYMTSGAGAQNLSYFNTSIDHLGLLNEAADALNNGDLQLANKWGNNFAAATGDPAPTNFDTIKTAVAGEVSKTFKGTGATDAEIAQINAGINRAESPDQLHGAITSMIRLMGGKLNAMRAQYGAAKQGLPAFPENIHGAGARPAGGGAPPRPGASAGSGSKGGRSVAAAMKYWADRRQPKSEQWVVDDLQKHGYTPVRP
jgi:hypothetical protein